MDQPGLEKRMGKESRRISSQHRQLDALYALVARALAGADGPEARSCFVRFCDALEAHFSLEDELYFPALHGMRPALESDLAQLSRDHVGFRQDLLDLNGLLEAGDLPGCSQRLDGFVRRLAQHEGREEQILERIQASVAAAGID